MTHNLFRVLGAACGGALLAALVSCASFVDATTSHPVATGSDTALPGQAVDDRFIETAVAVNLRKANPALREAHVSVTSDHGMVLLVGQVDSDENRELAAETARAVVNVRQVYNELTVAEPVSLAVRSNDAWLTTRVKSGFLVNQALDAGRITVVTENGVVYLMGQVTHDQAGIASDIASSVSGVQKVIRIFDYRD